MKDYKDYEELKKVLNHWTKNNPFSKGISINGEIIKLSFNMVYTIESENSNMRIGAASRAQNITETELKVHNLQHIDKILEYTKEHINS